LDKFDFVSGSARSVNSGRALSHFGGYRTETKLLCDFHKIPIEKLGKMNEKFVSDFGKCNRFCNR